MTVKCYRVFVVFTFISILRLSSNDRKFCLNFCALDQVIMREKIACLLQVKLRGSTPTFCRIS